MSDERLVVAAPELDEPLVESVRHEAPRIVGAPERLGRDLLVVDRGSQKALEQIEKPFVGLERETYRDHRS